MDFLTKALSALHEASTSVFGLVAFAITVIAWVIVSLRVTRNKNVLNALKNVPDKERAAVLGKEMRGTVYLAKGMTAEQYLLHEIQRYVFLGFLSVVFLTIVLASLAFYYSLHATAAPEHGLNDGSHPSPAPPSPPTDTNCWFLAFSTFPRPPLSMDLTFRMGDSATSYPHSSTGENVNSVLAILKKYASGDRLFITVLFHDSFPSTIAVPPHGYATQFILPSQRFIEVAPIADSAQLQLTWPPVAANLGWSVKDSNFIERFLASAQIPGTIESLCTAATAGVSWK